MKRVFFIVGPTATGKSEIAAEIARQLNAEIVSADAFQIYRGLDRLTAKPEKTTLAKAPHHLLSAVPLSEEMNVEKFRAAAVEAIRDIHARGKHAIVVGGSGLYLQGAHTRPLTIAGATASCGRNWIKRRSKNCTRACTNWIRRVQEGSTTGISGAWCARSRFACSAVNRFPRNERSGLLAGRPR